MAEISLGKVFMTPKGVWDRTKQYQSLDIVMVRGTTSSTGYISTDVIPANTPISDKRWKTLFTVNDGEATADFNNKVNKVDANKKAIDTIYAELQKMYGVQISDTEPTEERTGIWVDTSSTETFSVPEIKDNVVNTTDTWSSQKINQMVSVDSYAAKSDACADDDRVAIYDSVSKTQKKALFGGGVWNWIVNKLTNAVISNLQTNNKTVLGAINELNSNTKIHYKNIYSLSSLQQLKESTIFRFDTIDPSLLIDKKQNKMTDTTGDYYAILLAADFTNNGGVAYGTLLLFSPRIYDGFWIGNIWRSEIRTWNKITPV